MGECNETVDITHRPWGSYQVLSQSCDSNYAIKKLIVNPGNRLSLQYHHHRTEHWFVVKGSGIATVNDSNIPLTPGRSVDIPCGSIHRLAANADSNGPLEVIEIQTGNILSEDDIVRISDDYGRKSCNLENGK